MIKTISTALAVTLLVGACNTTASTEEKAKDVIPAADSTTHGLFMDVHHLGAGKVKAADVAGAHSKDLATQYKYGVQFIKYWVDEKAGDVYCLSSSADTQSIRKTHADAHGLLPDEIFAVTPGQEAVAVAGKSFYLDIHELGAGKVTAKDVEGAHQKDIALQGKYGVNFVNYWVDEKAGRVVCLSQSADTASIIKTHKEAHGLLPTSVVKVVQGQ
ncbi:DUF4242 domain-containing protein [Sediminibacterium roseum]|uniref:DUF4242 domain-containing protein n=1 Tax=Sediminibacterium roseum TaxID=1978412 RepID=A0ABW9ZQI2_9BACT|nr:DUF4242 domain-containing protein [Sediminibacterium roseum]NCI49366.1 DUF4242 domain-containing protein [Sediminibacterium roseum]